MSYGAGMTKTPKDMDAERIKRIRGRANLTQGDLADILRMSDLRTIRRWESGEYQITGPASVILELIEADQLPARFYAGRRYGDSGYHNVEGILPE